MFRKRQIKVFSVKKYSCFLLLPFYYYIFCSWHCFHSYFNSLMNIYNTGHNKFVISSGTGFDKTSSLIFFHNFRGKSFSWQHKSESTSNILRKAQKLFCEYCILSPCLHAGPATAQNQQNQWPQPNRNNKCSVVGCQKLFFDSPPTKVQFPHNYPVSTFV